jgi:mannose/fructose-specific phosphotransferase system component IIA
MSNATTARKTSKAALKSACDSFFWFLSDLTGGTPSENAQRFEMNLPRLETKAATVLALAANPAKLTLADSWLMERAASVTARVATYRGRYEAASEAANVVPFRR